jgi:hypothetical protein
MLIMSLLLLLLSQLLLRLLRLRMDITGGRNMGVPGQGGGLGGVGAMDRRLLAATAMRRMIETALTGAPEFCTNGRPDRLAEVPCAQHRRQALHNILGQRELLLRQAEFPLDGVLRGARPLHTGFLWAAKEAKRRASAADAGLPSKNVRAITLSRIVWFSLTLHAAREDVRSACILV